MKIDGNDVKFNNEYAISEAHTNGVISDSTFARYQEA